MRRILLRTAMLGCLAALPATASATILLFDQERDAATRSIVVPASAGGALPPDYGDRVTGQVMAVRGGHFTYGEAGEGFTPNVVLDIFSAAATADDARVNLWQEGYGDLVNVIFAEGPGTAGAPLLSVRFTADPGYVVDLYGFDLAGFSRDYEIAGVSVFAASGALFNQPGVLVHGDQIGPQRTTFAFAAPLSAPEMLLQIDLSNLSPGIQDNVALDSLRFGQTPPPAIPEPATTTLLLAGLAVTAALGWRRRSQRRSG